VFHSTVKNVLAGEVDVHVDININSNNDPINMWCRNEMNNRWNHTNPTDYKHSKKYIKNVDDKLSKQLINLTRKEIRVAIGLITGRYCRECETETTKHILEDCPAFSETRKRIFIDNAGEKTDWYKTNIKSLLKFSKETKLYDTFYYYSNGDEENT
jgi:hypothetical protein